MEGKKTPGTIDEYIAQFPEPVQQQLFRIRAIIREAAPEATEKISYGMPAFYQNGYLVGFAAHKHHLGFYPAPSGLEALKEELSGYKGTKGSVHFPLDEPAPAELIAKIVHFRLEENRKK